MRDRLLELAIAIQHVPAPTFEERARLMSAAAFR